MSNSHGRMDLFKLNLDLNQKTYWKLKKLFDMVFL